MPEQSLQEPVAIRLDTIEEAIADIRAGRMIIVVDDEDRENEGDFVIAARHATPEVINFMAKEGRGLICTPLTEERCRQLGLELMVADPHNTDRHGTAFTVSVDLKGHGNTTGISAQDRARTIQALVSPETQPTDLARPGHIFPLIAKDNGVLRRSGHTEAAIDFARLAGYEAAGVIVEIMNEDGTMARLPELLAIADRHGLKLVSIEDLIRYRLSHESLVTRELEVPMDTRFGQLKLMVFSGPPGPNAQQHLAIVRGTWEPDEPVLVRMNSAAFTSDLFTTLFMERNNALAPAMRMIDAEQKGVVVYMNQAGVSGNLLMNLKAYQLQQQGKSKADILQELGVTKDQRDFGLGAQILREVGVRKMRLISNHPMPRAGLSGYGLEIVETVPVSGRLAEQ